MALIKTIDFGDGFVAEYHRIGAVTVGGPNEASTVTVESFTSFEDRARPGSALRRRDYDVIVPADDPVPSAYRSLAAHPDFEDATSDIGEVEPAAIAAVRAGLFRWDGAAWQPLQPPKPLEEVRLAAYLRVDGEAGQARLRYITSVPGQAETYTRKEAQARAWQASGFAGAAPSFIAAEAAALGVPAQQVAEEVIGLADFWEQAKGPEIEAARIAGKAAVRAATSEASILAAADAAVQALEAL